MNLEVVASRHDRSGVQEGMVFLVSVLKDEKKFASSIASAIATPSCLLYVPTLKQP